jgi:hypothetical protein
MKELKKLRKLHPGVTIIYADNYGAAMEIFLSPEQYGELGYLPFCSNTKFSLYLFFDRLESMQSNFQKLLIFV